MSVLKGMPKGFFYLTDKLIISTRMISALASLRQLTSHSFGIVTFGDIAFGRQSNRLPRRITEKSLAESFLAEC